MLPCKCWLRSPCVCVGVVFSHFPHNITSTCGWNQQSNHTRRGPQTIGKFVQNNRWILWLLVDTWRFSVGNQHSHHAGSSPCACPMCRRARWAAVSSNSWTRSVASRWAMVGGSTSSGRGLGGSTVEVFKWLNYIKLVLRNQGRLWRKWSILWFSTDAIQYHVWYKEAHIDRTRKVLHVW